MIPELLHLCFPNIQRGFVRIFFFYCIMAREFGLYNNLLKHTLWTWSKFVSVPYAVEKKEYSSFGMAG